MGFLTFLGSFIESFFGVGGSFLSPLDLKSPDERT